MTTDTRVSQAGVRFGRNIENLPWGFWLMDSSLGRERACSLSPLAGRGKEAALIAHHHQPVVAGFPTPGLARTAQHLAHAGAALVARAGRERLGYRIESLDRIGEPVGRPSPVLVIHIDR